MGTYRDLYIESLGKKRVYLEKSSSNYKLAWELTYDEKVYPKIKDELENFIKAYKDFAKFANDLSVKYDGASGYSSSEFEKGAIDVARKANPGEVVQLGQEGLIDAGKETLKKIKNELLKEDSLIFSEELSKLESDELDKLAEDKFESLTKAELADLKNEVLTDLATDEINSQPGHSGLGVRKVYIDAAREDIKKDLDPSELNGLVKAYIKDGIKAEFGEEIRQKLINRKCAQIRSRFKDFSDKAQSFKERYNNVASNNILFVVVAFLEDIRGELSQGHASLKKDIADLDNKISEASDSLVKVFEGFESGIRSLGDQAGAAQEHAVESLSEIQAFAKEIGEMFKGLASLAAEVVSTIKAGRSDDPQVDNSNPSP